MDFNYLQQYLSKTISVVIDYKNPSGFNDNVKGVLTNIGEDYIVIVPKTGFCKKNLMRWQYIKSIRLYED